MKIVDIKEKYSYLDFPDEKFNENKFILAVRDDEFPEKNIIPILYYEKDKVLMDIDHDEMGKIYTTPNNHREMLPISERFTLRQIFKISVGFIKSNDRWVEGSSFPKCITFHTNLYPCKPNEIIEIFEGVADEGKSRVKIEEDFLLSDKLYLENNMPFFVKHKNTIIGPFIAIKKDSEGYFVVMKSNYKTFGEYLITEDAYIEFEVNLTKRMIHIPHYNNLELLKELEFKSDKELLNDFKNILNQSQDAFNAAETSKILQILDKITNLSPINLQINKNLRLKEIIKNTRELFLSEIEIIKLIPEVAGIKKEIERYKDLRFEIENDLKKLNENKNSIVQDIENCKNDLERNKIELESVKEIKEEQLLKQKSNIANEIKELEYKKNNLSTEISKEEIIFSAHLNRIKYEIEIREKDKADLDNTIKDLENIINKLKIENLQEQKNAQTQLFELLRNKKYFDFFSGRDIASFEDQQIIDYRNYEISPEKEFSTYESFRNKVIELINSNGRSFDNHFIDNLLISIFQNQMTIFAGLPGTGKTSLARILTNILTPKERTKEIAVSKGWTSQKDLIGFFNPLTNKFNPANTEFYDILKQLDHEANKGTYLKSPLSFVILDEANLSPLEHYWSLFYNLADSVVQHNSLIKLNLGGKETVKYSNNLRFLATINFDPTTERLSPKIIDRVNIIQIPLNKYINTNEISFNNTENLSISYQKCIEFFKLLDFSEGKFNFELDDEISQIYQEIKQIFYDLKLIISPRVEIAIKRYCNIAKNLMRESSRPLDYCVAQRLLPTINTQGEKQKQHLLKLLNVFSSKNMDISEKILEQIIKCGEDGGVFEDNYNYFLTFSYV